MVRSAPLARRLGLFCALVLLPLLGACSRESEGLPGAPPSVAEIPRKAERSSTSLPDPLSNPDLAIVPDPGSASAPPGDGGRRAVRINGERIPDDRLAALELARRAGGSGGGDGWYSQASEAGGNESGGSGYVMGRDGSGNVWSVSY